MGPAFGEGIARCLLDKAWTWNSCFSPDLVGDMLEVFKRGKTFLDYVNRAIDFCREDQKEYFTSIDF